MKKDLGFTVKLNITEEQLGEILFVVNHADEDVTLDDLREDEEAYKLFQSCVEKLFDVETMINEDLENFVYDCEGFDEFRRYMAEKE